MTGAPTRDDVVRLIGAERLAALEAAARAHANITINDVLPIVRAIVKGRPK